MLASGIRSRPALPGRAEEPDQRAHRPVLRRGPGSDHVGARLPADQVCRRSCRAPSAAAGVRAAQGGHRVLRDEPGRCRGHPGPGAGDHHRAGNKDFLKKELGFLPPDEEWKHLIFGRGSADQLGGVVSAAIATKILLELEGEGALKGAIVYSYATACEEDNDGAGPMYLDRKSTRLNSS